MKTDRVMINIGKRDFDHFVNVLKSTITEMDFDEISLEDVYERLTKVEWELDHMFYNDDDELMLHKDYEEYM